MKTIDIMKQLLAKHFNNKDEFVKELNKLCWEQGQPYEAEIAEMSETVKEK